jgi:hypothetical protein
MRTHVRHSRSERNRPAPEEGHESGGARKSPPAAADAEPAEDLAYPSDGFGTDDTDDTDGAADPSDDDLGEVVRLSCPGCGQPIAVFADEQRLPRHALCPTPWNPFGLTVCDGSGHAVSEARPLDAAAGVEQRQELAVLLTLPAGLDWRTQPFSHVGGPESRPRRLPEQRLAA